METYRIWKYAQQPGAYAGCWTSGGHLLPDGSHRVEIIRALDQHNTPLPGALSEAEAIAQASAWSWTAYQWSRDHPRHLAADFDASGVVVTPGAAGKAAAARAAVEATP